MNILIVDDSAANRKLLRAQLEAEGYSVLEASDGVEAFELLTLEPPAAVISDILMPRMDGYRLCHEVRKDAALSGVPFILYSSTYTAPADMELGGTVGADQFITKPAPAAVILEALRDAIKNRAPRPVKTTNDATILERYSAVLVAKLEEKNQELLQALDASRHAHHRIRELNLGLEDRARERARDGAALVAKLEEVLSCARMNEGKGHRAGSLAAVGLPEARL